MKPLVERLRDEAETAEKGAAFMDDGNLIADTLVEVALLREAASELERLQGRLQYTLGNTSERTP